MGSKHIELLPMMVPTLILFLKDESPAVARQAIITGTFLFRTVLEKIAIEVNDLSCIWLLFNPFIIYSIIGYYSSFVIEYLLNWFQ